MTTDIVHPTFDFEIEDEIGNGKDRSKNLRRVAFVHAVSILNSARDGEPLDYPHDHMNIMNDEYAAFQRTVWHDMSSIIAVGIAGHKKRVEQEIGKFDF
jgi:hypothetical protein